MRLCRGVKESYKWLSSIIVNGPAEVCSKFLQTTATAAGGPKIRKLTRYHNSSYPSGLLIYFDKHLGPRENWFEEI